MFFDWRIKCGKFFYLGTSMNFQGKKKQPETTPSLLLKSGTVHHMISLVFPWKLQITWTLELNYYSSECKHEGKKKGMVSCSFFLVWIYQSPKHFPAIYKWGSPVVYSDVIMQWHAEDIWTMINHGVHAYLGSFSF